LKRIFPMALTILALVAALTVTVVVTGASSLEAGTQDADDQNAIESLIAEANNVILSVGQFQSETGLTSDLSDDEIQTLVNAYNGRVDATFTEDYPSYSLYKETNENLLRSVFKEKTSYRVDGDTLKCQLSSIDYNSDRTSANVSAYLYSYNKWVDSDDNQAYSITCCAGISEVVATVEKADGTWKVASYEINVLEDWTPEDSADTSTTAISSEDQVQAASIIESPYNDFNSALISAKSINVEESCNLDMADVISPTEPVEIK